jgi:nitrate reductase delta subunit
MREPTEMLRLFAAVLDYPGPQLREQCRALEDRLTSDDPAAGTALSGFRAAADSLSAEQLEEIYTTTFDLNPSCCLYAGFHLFGESYKRGALMAKLNAEYHARGYDCGSELPDHLPVLLRFLADLDDPELCGALLAEVVLPALSRVAENLQGSGNLYERVVQAARAALRPPGHAPPPTLSETAVQDRPINQ